MLMCFLIKNNNNKYNKICINVKEEHRKGHQIQANKLSHQIFTTSQGSWNLQKFKKIICQISVFLFFFFFFLPNKNSKWDKGPVSVFYNDVQWK